MPDLGRAHTRRVIKWVESALAVLNLVVLFLAGSSMLIFVAFNLVGLPMEDEREMSFTNGTIGLIAFCATAFFGLLIYDRVFLNSNKRPWLLLVMVAQWALPIAGAIYLYRTLTAYSDHRSGWPAEEANVWLQALVASGICWLLARGLWLSRHRTRNG